MIIKTQQCVQDDLEQKRDAPFSASFSRFHAFQYAHVRGIGRSIWSKCCSI